VTDTPLGKDDLLADPALSHASIRYTPHTHDDLCAYITFLQQHQRLPRTFPEQPKQSHVGMNDTLAQQQAQHKTNFSSSIASSRLGFPIKNDMMTRVELGVDLEKDGSCCDL
jgi:hypothetical protein